MEFCQQEADVKGGGVSDRLDFWKANIQTPLLKLLLLINDNLSFPPPKMVYLCTFPELSTRACLYLL